MGKVPAENVSPPIRPTRSGAENILYLSADMKYLFAGSSDSKQVKRYGLNGNGVLLGVVGNELVVTPAKAASFTDKNGLRIPKSLCFYFPVPIAGSDKQSQAQMAYIAKARTLFIIGIADIEAGKSPAPADENVVVYHIKMVETKDKTGEITESKTLCLRLEKNPKPIPGHKARLALYRVGKKESISK